ncbi:MAG: hypothetical protein ACD_54C00008G0001 [uncultured bacterium]|nr:MAG: hypothetical protein ACD_54C00008G0001 [uncultured bacterium]
MLVVRTTRRLDRRLANGVFQHEVAHEFAGLDVRQHSFHAGFGFVVGQNPRAGDILAILGGVRDRVIHVGDAAFIDQVNDQLHFVQALEIGHFRLVACFNQRLEPHADQLNQAAAENSLFAEQVGFAFLTEVGLDDARTAAADTRAIGQADFHRFAGCIGMHRHKARHAAAFGVFAAHGVAGAFGGHHDDVDALFRLDQAEMDVQAVGKGNRSTLTDVVVDVFLVGFSLQLVGHGEHDQIGPSRGFGDAHDLQAFGFGFLGGRRAFAQRDHKVFRARIAQVQRMGVALAAVAENGDLFVLDDVHIAVTIVINAHLGAPSLVDGRSIEIFAV